MRQGSEFFGEQELVLIYVAKRLKQALKLEDRLTEAGLDYLVEPDKYTGGIVFRTERVGAFFYVAPGDEEAARALLAQHGYKAHERI
jgi:hypothetical protein